MNSEQDKRMAVILQGAEEIRRSNLLSDTFASIALEDIPACQYVVRMLTGIKDLTVIEVKSQYRLLNMTSKDAILDGFAQDGEGRLINIEIQSRDTVDHARRTRYYGSMIDKSSLDKGAEYSEMADVYIIYISETDIWKAGETIYPVKKFLGNSMLPYDDGIYVIYVNAAVDDGSDIARMMKYFKTADPNDMSRGDLSKRMYYLKNEKGGQELMCSAAEKIFNSGKEIGAVEEKKRIAVNFSTIGFSEEKIAEVLKVSADVVKEWLSASGLPAM
ncbi:MAG: PD-(D/E)XK nuclease family transposase [Eubacterium sp.]|nr:PD-(D/E)XK nuclease family transposase [Eubacterium sp.]